MSKPLGIMLGIDSTGLPRMCVTPINRVSDMIWDAVREAVCANMIPEQFKRESASAWAQCLRDDAAAAADEWSKK